ncbi:hypothetical protein POVCU2_0028390 [Plasmodium ovale curtisi]|uniref:Uncharacterized protein n=1 Tax=Plasmodium ovale curtisi TaxID=864141 RepID=A0A1A8X4T8_PLAOA|nr:hypothetical protein POVCU2_0028390 [Plasmodium ovale curtisi]SBT00287.1 hypothetical protein POVCU1_058940 [Plasmodium ovale curtisi]
MFVGLMRDNVHKENGADHSFKRIYITLQCKCKCPIRGTSRYTMQRDYEKDGEKINTDIDINTCITTRICIL